MFNKNITINYKDKYFIKDVLKKALPLIIGTILVGLTNLVDNFMIGQFQAFGAKELSASTLTQRYLNICLIFVQASIALFSFLIFQYKGIKNNQKMNEVIKMLIIFVVLIDLASILICHYQINNIMKFFQGSNFNDINSSTQTHLAQNYSKILIFNIIPISLFLVYINVLNAYGKQKVLLFISPLSLIINIFFNWFFYKGLNLGLSGIAFSTIIGDTLSFILVLFYLWRIHVRHIFINPIYFFSLDKDILFIGLKRIFMSIQVILWSSISISIGIIYSNWYGDIANDRLAIVVPVARMFYSALDGIAGTKGYFVGTQIGKGDKEKAYINDKRINLYTFIISVAEGLLLISFAYPIPIIWNSVSHSVHIDATIMLICIGATYPIAAISKTLLGSFKVAGMGKTIVLSNGVFALCFELLVPLILFLIHKYFFNLNISFWTLYLIARCIKLIKLPPTYYFWRKLKWLEKAI